jgi:hypothetical protein
MSDKIVNLNDAILDINPNCQFENKEPYTDYSNISWFDGSPIVSQAEAEARMAELQAIEDAKPTLEEIKTSARTKLIAGEALTEDEANTIVL